jgi:hypothetical protein
MEWIHIIITSPTQNISPNDQTIGQTKQLDKQPIPQKVELVEQVETPNVWMMNVLMFGNKKIVFY